MTVERNHVCLSMPPLTHEWDVDLASANPLRFPGYDAPAPQDESVRTGVTEHPRGPLVVIECRFDRHGGTMGVAAGERIVRAFDRAREERLPVAAFVASGGARLQEGLVSLTQMARTAGAVGRLRRAGLPFAAVLRPHTTGGVYASWASLADVLAAEPGATIGFAGPRVVAQVTGSFPPADSHTAEAAYTQGRVDALVGPEAHWVWLGNALYGPGPALRLPPGRPLPAPRKPVPRDPWAAVLHARDPRRPSGLEWSALLTEGWVELRGGDPAVRAGLAVMAGERLVVVAMDRHSRPDAAARVLPAGFRLAQRAFDLAERLRLPVLTLIDTPGAEPGPAAEADGVAGEIARTLLAMSGLTVPTVAVCVGEGGSGGAMAFAYTDRLFLLEGSVFSVIGPEPGAAVLFRDASRAAELARSFRLTAVELARLGVVDDVLPDGDVDAIRSAVLAALREAHPGERDARMDRLARSHLRRPAMMCRPE
ncbi:carboxyl transferase domain-containing protein [Streptomyces sp. NBC_00183]|uniref:carboxyl transferase domain-containing protein n=1 Tax=Streptomyces sp. NBC_00183 TaxID=2903633 RepID=UPI00225302EF|nr:carboxyl transferase domain-containing protein [Streptomyces sp. NBC_00183]MCX5294034.1 acetyl-CoA carboxylase [Streptomyces sp. NBC_00183]